MNRSLLFLLCFLISSFNNSFSFENFDNEKILDLSIKEKEFVEYFLISPDSEWIAYSSRNRFHDVDTSSKAFLPNDTPYLFFDSQIHLVKLNNLAIEKEIIIPQKNSWNPSWSPDSTKIAFYSDSDGYPQLWIYDILTQTSQKLSNEKIQTNVFFENIPKWSPDGKNIFFPLDNNNHIKQKEQNKEEILVLDTSDKNLTVSKDIIENVFVFSSKMASVNIETLQLNIDEQLNDISIFEFSDSFKSAAYISLLNLPTNHYLENFNLIIKSSEEEITIPYVNHPYAVIPYQWKPNKETLVYVKEDKLFLIDLKDNKFITNSICQKSNIKFHPDPLYFTEDGNFLIVGGKSENNKRRAENLFVISFEDENIINIPLEEDEVLVDVINKNKNQVWQKDPNTIIIVIKQKSTSELKIVQYDYVNKLKKEVLYQGFGTISNFFANEKLYCFYEDLNTPKAIFCFDNFKDKECIVNINSELSNIGPYSFKIIETIIPQYDGKLKTVYTPIVFPSNYQEGKPLPAIVMLYGGYNFSNIGNFYGASYYGTTLPNYLFLNAGFALIFPDTLLPESAGEKCNPIKDYTDMLLPQIYHAANLGYVDIERIGIAGHCYGGQSVAGVISKTNLFRAAVASSHFYDIPGYYTFIDPINNYPFMYVFFEEGMERMGKDIHPWNNLQRYLDNSPYYQAEKINTPLLLLQGQNDVPASALSMFGALYRLGKNAQLVLYPEGHALCNFSIKYYRDVSIKILDFFEKELKEEKQTYL